MDLAKLCAESQRRALDFVKEVTLREEINCQFAESTAYLFASDKGDADTVRREYEISKQLGIDAEYYERPAFPPDNFGMLAYPHQAVFHPVRYVEGLARRAEGAGRHNLLPYKSRQRRRRRRQNRQMRKRRRDTRAPRRRSDAIPDL
jgi:glycine/D-amino acid oxidase-like deaminating enzyme